MSHKLNKLCLPGLGLVMPFWEKVTTAWECGFSTWCIGWGRSRERDGKVSSAGLAWVRDRRNIWLRAYLSEWWEKFLVDIGILTTHVFSSSTPKFRQLFNNLLDIRLRILSIIRKLVKFPFEWHQVGLLYITLWPLKVFTLDRLFSLILQFFYFQHFGVWLSWIPFCPN